MKQRPAVVTAACALMFTVAALGVVSAVLEVVMAQTIRDRFQQSAVDAYLGASKIDVVTMIMDYTAIPGAVAGGLIAIGYGALGFLNLRGINGARIATWVFSGLFLLCGTCNVGWGVLGFFSRSDGWSDMARLNQALREAIPTWYSTVSLVLDTASVLCYVAVILLLRAPAASEFFRPQKSGVDRVALR